MEGIKNELRTNCSFDSKTIKKSAYYICMWGEVRSQMILKI